VPKTNWNFLKLFRTQTNKHTDIETKMPPQNKVIMDYYTHQCLARTERLWWWLLWLWGFCTQTTL